MTGRAAPNFEGLEPDGLGAQVVDLLEEGVIIYDRTGAVLHLNRAARRMLGRRSLSLPGRALPLGEVTVVDGEGAALGSPMLRIEKALEAGEASPSRVIGVVGSSGERLWLQAATGPIHSGDGDIVGAMSTFVDVTDREEALRALEASEAHHRGLVDALTEALVSIGPDGVIDSANPAAADMFGGDIAGSNVHQVRWPARRRDGGEMSLADFPEVAALHGQHYAEALFARILPDGSEQWLHTSAAPRGDGGVVALARDVTDLFTAREAAAASEQRFTHALEHLDHELGLYAPVFDDGGQLVDLRVEYLNPAGVQRRRKQVGELASEVFAHPESAIIAAREAHQHGAAAPYRFVDGRMDPPRRYEVRTTMAGDLVMMVCLDRTIGDDPTEIYRNTLDGLTEGTQLSTPVFDAEGQLVDIEFVFSNQVAHRLHPGGDHVGRRASEVFPEWATVRPLFADAWGTDGEAHSTVIDNLDGAIEGLPSYCILLRVRRVGDLLVSIGTDLTEQQRTRRALEESEARYRAVVDSLTEGVLVLDDDGVVLAVNPAALASLEVTNDVIGTPAVDWPFRGWDEDGNTLTGETLPGVVAVRTQQATEHLLWWYLRDERRWMQVRAVPVDPSRRGPVVVTFRDVTEEHELARALGESEERHRNTLTHLPDPVLELSPIRDGDDIVGLETVFANPAAQALDGALTLERLVPAARRVWAGGDETVNLDGEGRRWAVKVARAGEAVVAVARDVTESLQAVEAAERAIDVDGATGLASRIRLERYLTEQSRHRNAGSTAVLLVRIAELERQRAGFGFAAGEAIVDAVVERLEGWAGKHGWLAARVSEASFAVTADNVVSVAEARDRAQELADAVSGTVNAGGMPAVVAVSVGVAVTPLHGEDADAVLRRAGAAAAFAAGRGSLVEVWRPGLQGTGKDRLELVNRLPSALEGGEVYLEYQPRYALGDGAFLGFEAQAVWQHPGRGRLAERAFLPLLAGSEPLLDYVRWVVMTAVNETASALGQHHRVGVNLPAAVAASPRFASLVTDGLLDAGAPGSVLAVELAERGGGVAFPTTEHLAAIRDLDIAVRLDDFGAQGTSSLVAVARSGIDGVNLDRSLSREVAGARLDQRIVAACVDVAHAAGASVYATGVETQAARDRLAELGCDGAQGYWYARPVSGGALANGWRPSPPR